MTFLLNLCFGSIDAGPNQLWLHRFDEQRKIGLAKLWQSAGSNLSTKPILAEEEQMFISWTNQIQTKVFGEHRTEVVIAV